MVKRISALFLAMIMVLSMGISVFAAGPSTVTINGGDNSLDGKTFSAYKLFDVTTAEDDKYGYTPTADFEEWLKTQAGNSYSDDDASLYDYVFDQMKAAGTAQIFLAALKTEAADQTAAETGTGSGNKATISGLSDGYYVIFCSDDSFSPNALTVTEDTTVYTKVTTPTIDKTAGDEDKDWTDAQIGDSVPFNVTVQVPNTEGMYMESYTFKVTDQMSEGLTFDVDSVSIKIGNAELTKDTDYKLTVGTPDADGTEITFNFVMGQAGSKNLSQTLLSNVGKNMVISYSAVLNENAVSETPETNNASLEYTNNSGTVVSGDTAPDDTTQVYTYEYDVFKTDGTNPLPGAQFEIYKKGENTPIKFETAGKGQSYCVAMPDAVEGTTTTILTTAEVNGNQAFNIYGLKAGTYLLRETKAPDGYNKLKNDIEFTISANDDGTQTANHELTVVNHSGSLLPETGGTGAAALAAVGVLIVLGGGFVLIRNRKRG